MRRFLAGLALCVVPTLAHGFTFTGGSTATVDDFLAVDHQAIETRLDAIDDCTTSQVPIGAGANAATTCGQVTAAILATDSVSADELNATGVESELEAVLDLDQMQGTISDSQIAAGAVDGGNGGEIADGSITADDLAADSVAASEIAAGAVGDAELEITASDCFNVWAPTAEVQATDDIKTVFRAPVALTITEVYCETTTGTVTMDVQIDDGTPADVMGSDLACDSSGETDNTSLTGSMAAGDRLDFAITSVATNPTGLAVCIVYTR